MTLTSGKAWAVGSTPADIDFLQLLDVAEDVAQLRADLLLFLGRERQPREVRDIFDINFSRAMA